MARQPEQSEKDDQRRDEQHQNPVVQHSRPLQLLSGRGSETHHALGEIEHSEYRLKGLLDESPSVVKNQ